MILNIVFVDLVPHTAFFDKAYFMAFEERQQNGLDEYLKNNEQVLQGLRSARESHLEPNTSGTLVNYPDGQLRLPKETEEFSEFKLLPDKQGLSSLEGLTLETLKFSADNFLQKKGGLGKIYFSSYCGFPVGHLMTIDQNKRDPGDRFQSFCAQTTR